MPDPNPNPFSWYEVFEFLWFTSYTGFAFILLWQYIREWDFFLKLEILVVLFMPRPFLPQPPYRPNFWERYASCLFVLLVSGLMLLFWYPLMNFKDECEEEAYHFFGMRHPVIVLIIMAFKIIKALPWFINRLIQL